MRERQYVCSFPLFQNGMKHGGINNSLGGVSGVAVESTSKDEGVAADTCAFDESIRCLNTHISTLYPYPFNDFRVDTLSSNLQFSN